MSPEDLARFFECLEHVDALGDLDFSNNFCTFDVFVVLENKIKRGVLRRLERLRCRGSCNDKCPIAVATLSDPWPFDGLATGTAADSRTTGRLFRAFLCHKTPVLKLVDISGNAKRFLRDGFAWKTMMCVLWLPGNRSDPPETDLLAQSLVEGALPALERLQLSCE